LSSPIPASALLRVRGERQRDRCAAEERDELASLHSITRDGSWGGPAHVHAAPKE